MKNCEFCEPENAKRLVEEIGLYLFIEKDYLIAGYSDMCTFESNESIKINYCPMCGRKLREL